MKVLLLLLLFRQSAWLLHQIGDRVLHLLHTIAVSLGVCKLGAVILALETAGV